MHRLPAKPEKKKEEKKKKDEEEMWIQLDFGGKTFHCRGGGLATSCQHQGVLIAGFFLPFCLLDVLYPSSPLHLTSLASAASSPVSCFVLLYVSTFSFAPIQRFTVQVVYIQCLYSVQCPVYSVQCVVYSVLQCAVYRWCAFSAGGLQVCLPVISPAALLLVHSPVFSTSFIPFNAPPSIRALVNQFIQYCNWRRRG